LLFNTNFSAISWQEQVNFEMNCIIDVMVGVLGIRIMCPSGATCLFTDCCFSELTI